MKTRGLFLTISLAALFVGNVFAQNPQTARTRPTYDYTSAGITVISNDTATIGAQMPYRVNPDPFFKSRPAIFDPSIFAWAADNGATITANAASVAGYYTDSIIRVTMPTSTATVNIEVAEMSQPKAGNGCVDPTPEQISVTVIAKPTLAIDQTAGSLSGCSAAGNINIGITLTGIAPFYVNYTITYTDWDGTSSAPVAYTATINSGEELIVNAADQLNAGQGTYRISVTDVWDTHSFRAINSASLNTAYTDRIFDIQLFPTPSTQPIQRLRTL